MWLPACLLNSSVYRDTHYHNCKSCTGLRVILRCWFSPMKGLVTWGTDSLPVPVKMSRWTWARSPSTWKRGRHWQYVLCMEFWHYNWLPSLFYQRLKNPPFPHRHQCRLSVYLSRDWKMMKLRSRIFLGWKVYYWRICKWKIEGGKDKTLQITYPHHVYSHYLNAFFNVCCNIKHEILYSENHMYKN